MIYLSVIHLFNQPTQSYSILLQYGKDGNLNAIIKFSGYEPRVLEVSTIITTDVHHLPLLIY